jgi:adenylate kinase
VPLNVLLLGLQGSGKGTQGKRLADEYGLAYIGTGDMLREAVAAGTEVGRRVQPILESGGLVPDELMIDLIADRIAQEDAADGFVLDGFPRTYGQASALDRMLAELGRDLTVVFELQVPHDVAVERLRRRAADEGRADDTPEAIERRIELYNRETAPLLEHYRARGKLIGIHGDRSVNEVFREVQDALEQLAVRE